MHDEHGERAVASGGGMAGPGDAFCVVISSIPGYGFCSPSRQLGWDTERVAQGWTELTRSPGVQPLHRAGRRLGHADLAAARLRNG